MIGILIRCFQRSGCHIFRNSFPWEEIMKKLILSAAALVFLLISCPQISSAQEGNDDGEEYNEFGIKIGTEVYGEDISELSEEQLQYIPEGWRDGNFEPEHDHEEEQFFLFRARTAFPDVNDYIKNLKVPSVRYEHKDFFTKFNYRNGYGAVEGVVAHETANDNSTISQEISYMSRNHQNAFVHAFVDHNNIIEIHPLGYGAWGAGRMANQRFVHVELVRVHSFDEFAKSINNYADYIANILYDYNLGVSSAENSGKGTLWSHKAVSTHLGYTNHVDPHGYFAKYGYNWNQFVELVNEKHNKLVASRKANTSKLGHLKFSDALLYSNPTSGSSSKAGNSNMNEVYYIKAEATISGSTYYLLSRNPSSSSGVLGWAKSSDVTVHQHQGVDTKSKTFFIKGNGEAYNKAWGGSKNVVYGDLSKYRYQEFKVNKTEKVGKNTWYRGTLGGKTVWIHENFVTTLKESQTSRLGHIKNKNVKVYHDIAKDNTSFAAGEKRVGTVYYIKKQIVIGSETYYLISSQASSTNGVIGWVNNKDMNTHPHKGVDTKQKVFHVKGTNNAYSKAWGGEKDIVYKLSNYTSKEFKVNKTETVGNNTWYRGVLNGKTVWIHEAHLLQKNESSTSKLGFVVKKNAKIYKTLMDEATVTNTGDSHLNTVYYIKKQAKFSNGQTYYLISNQPSSSSGVIGWMNEKDLNIRSHSGVDTKTKTFAIAGVNSAYSKAWGGSKDLIYNLSNYKYADFVVNKTEKVGNNIWYRGKLNNQTVWIHESHLLDKTESSTSKLGHFKSTASKIYEKPGDSKHSTPGNRMNSVHYIKKQMKIGKDVYYLVSEEPSSSSGLVGWVHASEMSVHDHKGVDTKAKTMQVKGSGKAFSKAWGGTGDMVYELSDYAGMEFAVNKTETVGKNTWYRGRLDGKTVFIHESYLN